MNNRLDFGGARGSNTGDVYHELWAVRAALQLLDESNTLDAVVVEGVPSVDGSGHQWDGVDCTLLFGGEDIQAADRVAIQQLKYSASKPNNPWTPSRVCHGRSATNPTSSLIRGLGKAFQEVSSLRTEGDLSDISIELVTNQPISDKLSRSINFARLEPVPCSFSNKWKKGGDELHRLVYASGLPPKQFKEFANCLSFVGKTNSRFLLEEKMLMEISAWTETEFTEVAHRLRRYVRNKMMPEAAGEIITKESVLLQFGVSDVRSLFPCPNNVKTVPNNVPRKVSQNICNAIVEGEHRILLHGLGGVGKSTVIRELKKILPEGSEVIVFDCYGAGSYMDASAMRHRPRDAFVQLANELACCLKLPAFIEQNSDIDFARAFRKRLEIASNALSRTWSNAMLVIAIDAADNSVNAADDREPKEVSFVADLVSFENLPRNVALVISARSGRRDELNLPRSFKPYKLLPFSRFETGKFVRQFWDAPRNWIDDFHQFTNGTPRVQNYAFSKCLKYPSEALEVLRPNGKSLIGIFEDQFEEAVRKSGTATKVEDTCAALAVLPRPIPVEDIAHILGLSADRILDICADLEPGVRLLDNTINFADEDFEHFAIGKGKKSLSRMSSKAAQRMLDNHQNSEYAALNVVPLLLKAGMGPMLLDFVESEPLPKNVSDPILGMEIKNQRLTNAIAVCRSAGNLERAIRFILIGAEALETHNLTRRILLDFPNLTSHFARTTASRLILRDRELVEEHGRLLLHILAREALDGNFSQVRETRKRAVAWFELRKEVLQRDEDEYDVATGWRIDANDMANVLVAQALETGAESAIKLFRNWRPLEFAANAAQIAIKRLVSEHRFEILNEISSELTPFLAPFVSIPLRLAGQPVDIEKLAKGLALLSRRYPVSAKSLNNYGDESALKITLSGLLLDGAEILAADSFDIELVKAITRPLWLADSRRLDNVYEYQPRLIDSILRSYSLHQVCIGTAVDAREILVDPPSNPEELNDSDRYSELDRRRQMKDFVEHVAAFYSRRSEVLFHKYRASSDNDWIAELEKSISIEHWQLHQSHRFLRMRSIMAEKLIVLVAADVPIDTISKLGFKIYDGFQPWCESSSRDLPFSLIAFSSQHRDLLNRVVAAVQQVRVHRMGGREKSELLAKLSELIVPISSEDARIIFQEAINTANELGSEATDQILFLYNLVIRRDKKLNVVGPKPASKLAEFVVDAVIRHKNVRSFPWKQAMESIAALDFSTALACVARWEDNGYVKSFQTLGSVILSGLKSGNIDRSQAAALLKLPVQSYEDVVNEILDHEANYSSSTEQKLIEEISRDIVTGTVDRSSKIELILLSRRGGVWLERLRRMVEKKTVDPDLPIVKKRRSNNVRQPGSILFQHNWNQRSLYKASHLHTAAKQIIFSARDSEENLSLSEVLTHASSQVRVKKCSEFLDALIAIIDQNDTEIIDVLFESIKSWSSQPSVIQWCEENLPSFIETVLPNLISPLGGESIWLESTLALLKETSAEQAVLRGIEKNGPRLTSPQIFQLTQVLSRSLTHDQCSSLLTWYLDRLVNSIDNEDRENISLDEIPATPDQAIARFLVAYMSDVDLRLRWRATHAGRRLARLKHSKELDFILDLYNQKKDDVFRAHDKPYYWLAARLWMMIMLDRICEESVASMDNVGDQLCQIAFDTSFPHILVRSFAVDACIKLINADVIQLSKENLAELSSINSGIPSTGAVSKGIGSFDDFFGVDFERFHFDVIDTLRYWYAPWLNVFEGTSAKNFLKVAERWIVDEWGVIDENPRGSQEPRKTSRFSDRDFRLDETSHGSLPTLERYRSHLEWHAMWCTAGEFLAIRPLKKSEYDDDDEYSKLNWEISYGKLTRPPYWLADFVTSHPLDTPNWPKGSADVSNWLDTIDDDNLLQEIFPTSEPSWVVVNQNIFVLSDRWRLNSNISTGLVSPGSALSLVRALQTCPNDFDFQICLEGHDHEIVENGFILQGWIKMSGGDPKFDELDPLHLRAAQPRFAPGSRAQDFFDLHQVIEDGLKWIDKSSGETIFRLELWGEQETDNGNHYLGNRVVSSGHRLMVEKCALAKLLREEQSELIADIGISKNETSQGHQQDFKETKRTETYNRLLLLERSGETRGAEKNFGPWRENRPRTRDD